jgi:hypothetical protein
MSYLLSALIGVIIGLTGIATKPDPQHIDKKEETHDSKDSKR